MNCSEIKNSLIRANACLKVFSIGIGDEVKYEYLKKIIEIGSEEGRIELLPKDVRLTQDFQHIVEGLMKLSIVEVYKPKSVELRYGPRNEEVNVKLTS